ncbi:hypothetical protein [Synechococcus sp. W55.1]|uniref:hypothetical protein n=1 Tax=Synechococcus sp. W55.1 TaxID=2964512 RepID=UPI0039C41D09
MATIIKSVNNESDTPVAYLGKQETLPIAPTGWRAWGFAPNANHDFGWEIETRRGYQALLTKAGVFYIWDNGSWLILYQKAGSTESVVLIALEGPWNPQIELTVKSDGMPSARQLS